MFDSVLLKEKIEGRGISFKELSYAMGINPATLYRKINGQSEFTVGEMRDLMMFLCLSDCDVKEIFLS